MCGCCRQVIIYWLLRCITIFCWFFVCNYPPKVQQESGLLLLNMSISLMLYKNNIIIPIALYIGSQCSIKFLLKHKE